MVSWFFRGLHIKYSAGLVTHHISHLCGCSHSNSVNVVFNFCSFILGHCECTPLPVTDKKGNMENIRHTSFRYLKSLPFINCESLSVRALWSALRHPGGAMHFSNWLRGFCLCCFSFLSNKAHSALYFSCVLCYIQIILIRSHFMRESSSDLIVLGAFAVMVGFLV